MLKILVLIAGRGRRMMPETVNEPKSMISINGKPILYHVISYWKQYSDDFVFVVNYKRAMIIDYIKTLDIKSTFVVQETLNGIAGGILCAEKVLGESFITVLGDCLFLGKLGWEQKSEMGIGVFNTRRQEDIRRSYSVEIENGLVKRVVEKPKEIVNDLCGMGFYYFRRLLFEYIRKTPASALRNEVEITDVIQLMVKHGERIKPIFFEGMYLNVTYPGDLETAKNIIEKES